MCPETFPRVHSDLKRFFLRTPCQQYPGDFVELAAVDDISSIYDGEDHSRWLQIRQLKRPAGRVKMLRVATFDYLHAALVKIL